jgi:hypothetical protein
MSLESQDVSILLKQAVIDARLGHGSVSWNHDGNKLAAALKEIIAQIDKAGPAGTPAPLTFDEWFAMDELDSGCRGTSELERDQMRASWTAAIVYGRGRKNFEESTIKFSADEAGERVRFAEWAGNAPVDSATHDRDTYWCWEAWKAAIGLATSVRGPSFLATVSMSEVKDHVIAKTVNKLRQLAQSFHAHGSLRDRIAYVLLPILKEPTIVTATVVGSDGVTSDGARLADQKKD